MLRWRLSIGLITLMVLLLAVGGYAVWLFGHIGPTIGRILETNYRSIDEVDQIRISALRINSTYVRLDPGALAPGTFDKTVFRENRDQILRALHTLDRIPLPPTDRQAVRGLDGDVSTYLALYDHVFEARSNGGTVDAMLFRKIQAETLIIEEACESLLADNQDAMFAADRLAQKQSQDSIRFLLVAMGLALAISGYASWRLGKSILDPIHILTDFTDRIGAGDLDITAPVLSTDELGRLAASFNRMAVQLRAYRQTTAERIFELNRTTEATLAAFPDPIYVIDNGRRISLRNPAAERFAEELGLQEELPPELRVKVDEVFETGADYLPATFNDALYYRLAGQEKTYLPRVLTMKNRDGSLHGLAVVLQDITRLRFLNDVKTNLLATVSHELRTPMTSIQMVLHILLERKLGALTPKQIELLDVAREDSERMLRTLGDLLDLSRLEGASRRLQYELVDPRDILREVAEEAGEAVRSRNLRLRSEGNEALPSLPLDRLRIKHVLAHFIDNATKHSPTGGTITLRARLLDEHLLRFSVVDDGEGIAAEHQARVFDKFFRVPGQPKTGLGLGLSVAQQIVQAHQGRIGVFSKLGSGSEFYCDLPLDAAAGNGALS